MRGILALFIALVLAQVFACTPESTDARDNEKVATVEPIQAPEHKADFADYWSEFRDAVLAEDWARIADLTQFPLVVRGALDDAARTTYSREQIRTAMELLLQQDMGLEAEFQPAVDFIEANEAPPSDAVGAYGESAVAGPFEFELTSAGWRLTVGYIEE